MRYVISILIILSLAATAFAKDPINVPKRYLGDVKAKLEMLDSIENATPYVSITGIEVVQDADNRVFVKDTASVDIRLSTLHYNDIVPIKATVKGYYHKKSGRFVSRFGLASVVEQRDVFSTQLDKNTTYLTFKFAGFKKLGLELLANQKRWGMGVSRTLTPNTFLLVGVNWKYRESLAGKTLGFAGMGFKF